MTVITVPVSTWSELQTPGVGLDAGRAMQHDESPESDEDVVPSSVWFGPALEDHEEQELLAFLGTHNGAAVLQWPRDTGHLARLRRVGLPRLLLVHPSTEPVPPDGPLQRSLPASCSDAEIHHNLLALCRAARRHRSDGRLPLVTDDGWVCTAAGRVELPPDEHRLAGPLLARFERPVDDAVLSTSEGAGHPSPGALEGCIARLRRHVNALGLEIARVPGAHVMRWCAL